jgi:hypothetical protein
MATRPATLTKKHFALLASALHAALQEVRPHPSVEQDASDGVHAAIGRVADALAQTNPAFDRQRFYDAAVLGKHSRTPARYLVKA